MRSRRDPVGQQFEQVHHVNALLGAGGYLSFAASGFLAVRGVVKPRQSAKVIP